MKAVDRAQATGLLTQTELIVEESLCLNLRGRLIYCSNCEDHCPVGALSLNMDAIEHDTALCTGCNSCLPVCPAGALRSTGFVPERFLRALGECGDQSDLHCRASSSSGGGIVVPCYRVLDVRLLAAAAAEGVTELRLHGLDHCSGCRYGDARNHIHLLVSQLDEWLGSDSPRLNIAPTAADDSHNEQRNYQDQPHMDRRTFLRFGGATSVSKAVEWLVPGLAQDEEDSEALPFYQTEDHPQRAVPYQQVLIARVSDIPWRKGRALPLKRRSLSETCSACLSCGQLCPTGALQASETAQLKQLSFDSALCTDCGLCVEICPHNAMISEPISDPAGLQGRTILLQRQQQICQQCRTPFLPTSEEALCPVCNNEKELDEAWLDMLSG